MTTLITGNFEQQENAEQALADLAQAGFAADDTARFFVDPPAAIAPKPVEGGVKDAHIDKATVGAASGASVGGLVGAAVGIAGIAVAGPMAPLLGAGVGAYVGSLSGAMANVDDRNTPQAVPADNNHQVTYATRKAGTLIAVVALEDARQHAAISILRTHGAGDIERAEGTIVDGQWTDFDRAAPLHRVA